MDISIKRIPHSGALNLSTIHGGYLVSRTYYGYSIREAKNLFKQYLRVTND